MLEIIKNVCALIGAISLASCAILIGAFTARNLLSRVAPETAVGPDRRAGERGLRGEEGAEPVARGAEVVALTGEGEKAFVAAVRALESGEAGSEVTATEEGLDGGVGGGVERAESFAVFAFVVGEEVVPAVVDELPEGRSAGAAGLVGGRHKVCS
jgi:hypothetical protein